MATVEAARAADGPQSGSAGFRGARDQSAFLSAWLAAVARDLGETERLVVMVEDAAGESFRALAVWPDPATEVADLASVIGDAAETDAPVARRGPEGRARLAAPVAFEGHVVAVVAAEARGAPAALGARLELAAGWLAARLWRRRAAEDRERHRRAVAALDILASTAEARGLRQAVLALVGALAAREELDRVSLGLARGAGGKGARIRLSAMSGAAWFRRRGRLVGALESAMEEALDQDETVAAPAPAGRRPVVDVAHSDAKAALGAGGLASVVIHDEARPVGVLTAESRSPLDEAALARLEAVAALAGPVLALKRRQHAWVAGRAVDLAARGTAALGDRRRPSWAFAAGLAVVLLALPFILTGALRVAADATLEGAAQKAAVAPFSGFVESAPARPGDAVRAGDTLLRLEERDLRLEAEKWRSELARFAQESRRALAEGDRAEAALIAARERQAEAELALALGKLERARIAAPVSGVVVTGDFSQRIGAPVETGELLFVVSPLDAFRVALEIDERDLGLLEAGQRGALALEARPRAPIPIELVSVAFVARAETGGHAFRAEARLLLDEAALSRADLLPGMEGVARIEVGQASYARIWTRRLRDWLRLQFWRWSP